MVNRHQGAAVSVRDGSSAVLAQLGFGRRFAVAVALGNDFWQRISRLIVFAYDVVGERSPVDRSRLFEFQNRQYAFLGIPLSVYYRECRPLSPRWRTVSMPNAIFRQSIVPLDELL